MGKLESELLAQDRLLRDLNRALDVIYSEPACPHCNAETWTAGHPPDCMCKYCLAEYAAREWK